MSFRIVIILSLSFSTKICAQATIQPVAPRTLVEQDIKPIRYASQTEIGSNHIYAASLRIISKATFDSLRKQPSYIAAHKRYVKEHELLYVIDGKVDTQGRYKRIKSYSIEKIDIIKPDSAVSIYGRRAINGVILISTARKPKSRPTRLTHSMIKKGQLD